MMIKIIETKTRSEINAFIKFPLDLYKNDNLYVPQLTWDMKGHFSDKNPFLKHADVKFFLAVKDGNIAGRIASIINPQHIRLHKEKAGFFGFFECINDSTVSGALLSRVQNELKNQGMETMRGPMNFSTNEECGFLIEGFDSPPMLMMPYNLPYYNDLMTAFGMSKSKDLHAYIYDMQEELPEKVLRVAALAERKGITVRTIDKKNFMADMKIFQNVYNSAWEKNWGFIPISDEELAYSAGRLKPLAVPDLTLIAEKDGEPIGFLGLIPDFNFVLRHMGGRLNPITILKALYYSRKITDLRLLLYGIKPEYRNRGVDALLFKVGHKNIKKGGYKRIEFSWILEDNISVIRICEMFGARLYKRYRVYEKKISGVME
ncbi:MAG: N-acetyltransferase [Nitrospirae bacterium]|nr:N-acetyltransferase [Nitrospirota bacterium]